MTQDVQLITYVDRLSGGGLADLDALLKGPLASLFSGVHLLPFFDPIDGADAGFDPIDHSRVDPRLGTWADVQHIASHLTVMADVIVNHVSSASQQFRDYCQRGNASPYADMFLTFDRVFPEGATEADLLGIYRPRPGLPFSRHCCEGGETSLLWTTFTPGQIDIDVEGAAGKAYLADILSTFAQHGIRMIRLDAAGYVIKKRGTSCFMIPETMAFIRQFTQQANEQGMRVLLELHAHHSVQIDVAPAVDWVYDFALPPLLLHAVYNGTARYLDHWLSIRPHNAVTVLDTHDGIGVIDIGPSEDKTKPGLIPDHDLDRLVETIHEKSNDQSRQASGAAASNLDRYQVNCTYFDALGGSEAAVLLTRAVQLFVPGIAQIYYVGLLAGRNDMALLEKTGVGRDINRHYFTRGEIDEAVDRLVVRSLFRLIRWRTEHPAFLGTMTHQREGEHILRLRWTHEHNWAQLHVDFAESRFDITYSDGGESKSLSLLA